MRYGDLIAIEGTDGCGKTTTLAHLKKLMDEAGWQYVITKEPGGTKLGRKIRQYLVDHDLNKAEQTKLFLIARQDHLNKVIIPALKEHKLIICDRYVLSNMAYQGNYYLKATGSGSVSYKQPYTTLKFRHKPVDRNQILRINELIWNFIYPTLTVYMEASPEYNIRRLRGRTDKSDRFDKYVERLQPLQHLQWQYQCALKQLNTPFLYVNADHNNPQKRAEIIFRRIKDYVID